MLEANQYCGLDEKESLTPASSSARCSTRVSSTVKWSDARIKRACKTVDQEAVFDCSITAGTRLRSDGVSHANDNPEIQTALGLSYFFSGGTHQVVSIPVRRLPALQMNV